MIRRLLPAIVFAGMVALVVLSPFAAAHSPVTVSLTSGHDVYSTAHEHRDVVWAWAGDDWVGTGYGQDSIHSGLGDDVARGGGGDDYLEGGEGADVLDGGLGMDICVGNSGPDSYLSCEFINP